MIGGKGPRQFVLYNSFGIPLVIGTSAVTGGRICIRSIHNRKYTTLHKPPPPPNLFGIDLSKVRLMQNSLKTFVEGIFITSTLNVNNCKRSKVFQQS